MEFVSIRIITDDVARLVAFYEQVTGTTATSGNENFAELPTASGTLALAGTRTVPLFGPGAAESGANRSVIIDVPVDDAHAAYEELRGVVEEVVVTEATTMPWATGRSCSATRTGISSTCSRRSPRRRGRSSASDADQPAARGSAGRTSDAV